MQPSCQYTVVFSNSNDQVAASSNMARWSWEDLINNQWTGVEAHVHRPVISLKPESTCTSQGGQDSTAREMACSTTAAATATAAAVLSLRRSVSPVVILSHMVVSTITGRCCQGRIPLSPVMSYHLPNWLSRTTHNYVHIETEKSYR